MAALDMDVLSYVQSLQQDSVLLKLNKIEIVNLNTWLKQIQFN